MITVSNNDPPRKLTFFGMIGLVMAGLKFKEWYSDYRRVPTEEDGLPPPGYGPIALHSPVGGEAPPLPERLVLDTEIPTAIRPKRKRSADCCVCCGLRCGLFWKAFGIVCLVTIAWQGMKLIFWAVKPTPTGLENMPEFNVSLGCDDAPYVYNPDQTTYSLPFSDSDASYTIDLQGGAVGTVILEDADTNAQEITMDLFLRTNDKSLLNKVTFNYPTQGEIKENMAHNLAELVTPRVGRTSCMRYDIVLRIPPQLKGLEITSRTVTQIQFAPEAEIDLEKLTISLYTTSNLNMLLPKSNVHAKSLLFVVNKGWLVGEVSIAEHTLINTNAGDTVTNLRILPVAQTSAEDLGKAVLETRTGAGRTDFFYISDPGAPHRTISSTHFSSHKGDMYLRYSEAEFSGNVQLKAPSYTTTGMRHGRDRPIGGDGTNYGWVGDANGEDTLSVQSQQGWVGLYF